MSSDNLIRFDPTFRTRETLHQYPSVPIAPGRIAFGRGALRLLDRRVLDRPRRPRHHPAHPVASTRASSFMLACGPPPCPGTLSQLEPVLQSEERRRFAGSLARTTQDADASRQRSSSRRNSRKFHSPGQRSADALPGRGEIRIQWIKHQDLVDLFLLPTSRLCAWSPAGTLCSIQTARP